ncbi:MAG: hypothetical protein JWP12_2759 [Bacteroidetes bacterium]|nr:hypothetical protein [Bacteroidota bacterium]
MSGKLKALLFLSAVIVCILYLGCTKDPAIGQHKTKNVVVIVVDGARYSETWGNSTHQFIPHRSAMLAQGIMCSAFYNNGYTFTNAGHTAITTGVYQNINNSGLEYPQYPSFFQVWQKTYNQPANKTWVIATKDKLAILSDCTDPAWKGAYRPMTDCGVNGLGTGYREDSVTFKNATTIFATEHPRLVLINFKQPDAAGHANDSVAYLQGIIDTDNYIYQIWQQLQADPFYKDQTTLFVTNDHGRHTPGHLDGFVSHTDNCEGCKHIELFAMGPDFKQNYHCNMPYSQIDLASTIAELMGIKMPDAKGKVISDIFIK